MKLQRARLAALQWWCIELVHSDPAIRERIWTEMHHVLEADEATLAHWLKRSRRQKMDPGTFWRLDAQIRHEWRNEHFEDPDDADVAAKMGVPVRTYRRYKKPRPQ